MRPRTKIRKRRKEAGIVLLIAIFILLLIGVVGIALVVSSGTESALAGNYRSAASVQYAAVAGLEEVRARLRTNDPNYFGTTDAGFIPPPGALGPCNPRYVLNPLGGEAVTPWDPGNPYYDMQFGQEFGAICASGGAPPSPSPTANSIWNRPPLNGLPFPSPYYKWVRINGVSEQSLNIDTGPTYDGISGNLIYYDGQNLRDTGSSGSQVYELTALAVMQNGSRRIVQYLVAPQPLNLSFPSALTLDGNNVQFVVPNTTNFFVSGSDQGAAGTCNPGAAPPVTAVGYTNAGDSSQANITNAIQKGPPASQDRTGNFRNGVAATPDLGLVTLSPNLTTIPGLNMLVQTITQDADVVINGNATQANLPSAMSATNPMTIVVNGNLTFSGWHSTGYGLLLVTGDFTYDPDASWDGIILVIGTGKMYSHQSGTGQIQGAVFLANTVNGSPFFDFIVASGGNGIYYSNCWVQAAQPTLGYKILSFHEISQ